jgi:acetate CoA/acetoacetate CoA-transferase beta subunit
VTVLGALRVDASGRLANWMAPGKLVPGVGGAMDLVAGAKRVIVAMQHVARGKSKIVQRLTLPPTAVRRVSLVVTDGDRADGRRTAAARAGSGRDGGGGGGPDGRGPG